METPHRQPALAGSSAPTRRLSQRSCTIASVGANQQFRGASARHWRMTEFSTMTPTPSAAASTPGKQPPALRVHRLGLRVFKIWIVNVADNRHSEHLFGSGEGATPALLLNNTRFAGSSFDFHGSPIAILKGRIIAVLLILLINADSRSDCAAGLPAGAALAALPLVAVSPVEHHLAEPPLCISWRRQGAYAALLLPIGIVVAAAA